VDATLENTQEQGKTEVVVTIKGQVKKGKHKL